jgi:hypothetical protein
MMKGLNLLLLIVIDKSLKDINDFIVHYFWVLMSILFIVLIKY